MSAFIDEHRERFGVEPICRTLDVSASAYYARASGERSVRTLTDEQLLVEIRRVHGENYECYGSAGYGSSCCVRGSRWRAARSSG